MDAVPILFGLGCAVSLWFAAQSRDPDAKTLAGALIIMWALMNTAWLLDAMWAFPLIDLGAGMTALTIWWARQTAWCALFAQTIFIRLELHMLDSFTGHAFLVSYIHALNATFAWMLVVVAYPGGGYASNALLRRFRYFRAVLSAASTRGVSDGR